MSRILHELSFVGLLVVAFTVAAVAAPPPLQQTRLYSKTAADCQSETPAAISPPIRQALQEAHVSIEKVELCNGGAYRIFTGHFKYDPQGQTTSYLHPLYARVAQANGFSPYSFVDVDDGVIVYVDFGPRHDLRISYEEFTP